MTDPHDKPVTGRHVLIAMVAFFGVIIAVNLTMAAFASRSWTGLEAKNGYVASQDYNAKLAAAARQQALGWTSSIAVEGRQLRLQLRDARGTGVAVDRIAAVLKRPVQQSQDVVLDFRRSAPGVYRAALPAQPGVWDVDFAVTGANREAYRKIFRIYVRKQ